MARPGKGHVTAAALGVNGGASPIPIECQWEFQQHFEISYRLAERPFSDYAPAYEYGYRMADKNRERAFEEIEAVLREDFLETHPNRDWGKLRGAVIYGWNRALRTLQ